jgi:hypothetical protein
MINLHMKKIKLLQKNLSTWKIFNLLSFQSFNIAHFHTKTFQIFAIDHIASIFKTNTTEKHGENTIGKLFLIGIFHL